MQKHEPSSSCIFSHKWVLEIVFCKTSVIGFFPVVQVLHSQQQLAQRNVAESQWHILPESYAAAYWLLPNPTSVGHNTELWLTFSSWYSATTTPAMMQEDSATWISGIVEWRRTTSWPSAKIYNKVTSHMCQWHCWLTETPPECSSWK